MNNQLTRTLMLIIFIMVLIGSVFKCAAYSTQAGSVGITTAFTQSTATSVRIPFQRKTFFTQGIYWAFYAASGSENLNGSIYFNTSQDGLNWNTVPTLLVTNMGGGYEFALWFDGTNVSYVRAHQANNNGLYYRIGIPQSNGTMVWKAAEQKVLTANENYRYADMTICVDSSNHACIGYVRSDINSPCVIINANTDGTWSTASNTQLATATVYSSAVVVPLTSGKVYAIYSYNAGGLQGTATPLYGKLWNGSYWEGEEKCTSSSMDITEFESYTAVAIGDNVYLAFTQSGTFNGTSVVRTSKEGWGTESTIFSGVTAYNTPCLSVNGSNLTCFWLVYSDNSIQYKNWSNSLGWDSIPSILATDSNGIPNANSAATISTSYSVDENGHIGVLYQAGPASPTTVKHDYVKYVTYTNSR